MTKIGTEYFISESAARRYYKPQGYDAADVRRKLAEGEIYVGRPACKPGDRAEADRDGRYIIITGEV